MHKVWHVNTVYPKKYAHGFCFAVLCCGYTLTDFPISIRLISLALWQSNDCPSASKATLMNMDEYFMWIHYERLHNHNKAKHNKTVCIYLGIYCIYDPIYPIPCDRSCHGPLARYVKLQIAHAPGMPGTFTLPLLNSDPDMHHGTCVTHVPWCMPGSLTSGFIWSRWRGKRSRHSRHMRNPQFYVSGKRPMANTDKASW